MPLDLNLLLTATDEENAQRFATAKALVQTYLAGLTRVKIFVADSRSFGHQSSSINILFNLIRLGCTATFTVVYENPNALSKVRVLLPINPDNVQPITLPTPAGGTVNVNFLAFNAVQPDCDLALTGGYDNPVTGLTGLNATYIIELQPFKWVQGGSQNAIYKAADATTYSLDDAINNFNQQAFYISNPTRVNAFWAAFATAYPTWTTTLNLTTKVLDLYGIAENFYFCPVYGINTGTIDPILSLFNLCCGVSFLQDQTTVLAARKAVIVSFSPVSQPGQDNNVNLATLRTLITDRNYPGKGAVYSPGPNCRAYLDSSALAARVTYYSGTDPNELETAINALASNGILVVQIGPIPAPVFNYAYYMANLPFVFEGQNTAALALNLGIPYLHITTPGNYGNGNLFPVLPPGNGVSSSNGLIATAICSKMSTYPMVWRLPTTKLTRSNIDQYGKPGVVDQLAPSYTLGKYAVEAKQANPDSNMIKYFKKFATFFHDEKNDKLIDALIYLNYNIINN